MADVAASANDPIFLNHHAMVDCIFETWLQNHSDALYPIDDKIPKGHRWQDYIVPFFPLYKHGDMLSTADKFGYRCTIKPEQPSKPSTRPSTSLDGGIIAIIIVGVLMIIVPCILFICLYIVVFYNLCTSHKNPTYDHI